MESKERDLTGLLRDAALEDKRAVAELFSLVHAEISLIARQKEWSRQRNPTLNTAALVNELYCRWIQSPPHLPGPSRIALYYAVALSMQDILIEHARRKRAIKRGGGEVIESLSEPSADDPADGGLGVVDHLALAEAMEGLFKESERQHKIVTLYFYAGLKETEIATGLGVAERTVRRDLQAAKGFLRVAMEAVNPGEKGGGHE